MTAEIACSTGDLDCAAAWLPVPGWEDIFEVNRLGQVCSLPRRVPRGGGWYRVRGGILTEQVINGHRAVYLKSCGRRETVYVEVLLREVFGPGATCAPRQLADSWR